MILDLGHRNLNIMKNSIFFIVATSLILTYSSCKKDKDNDNLKDRLIGTWMVAEIKQEPASGPTTTLQNVGTITFLNGGNGSYNLNYGNGANSGNFDWSAADNNATTVIDAGFLNPLSGQYTVITNTATLQTWQRINTDGDKFTYRLEK